MLRCNKVVIPGKRSGILQDRVQGIMSARGSVNKIMGNISHVFNVYVPTSM